MILLSIQFQHYESTIIHFLLGKNDAEAKAVGHKGGIVIDAACTPAKPRKFAPFTAADHAVDP